MLFFATSNRYQNADNERGLSMMARENGCRECVDCKGVDHHWMMDWDEESGKGYMACKHCDASREITDDDYDL